MRYLKTLINLYSLKNLHFPLLLRLHSSAIMFNNQLSLYKKKALIPSVCQILWYKYSNYAQVQPPSRLTCSLKKPWTFNNQVSHTARSVLESPWSSSNQRENMHLKIKPNLVLRFQGHFITEFGDLMSNMGMGSALLYAGPSDSADCGWRNRPAVTLSPAPSWAGVRLCCDFSSPGHCPSSGNQSEVRLPHLVHMVPTSWGPK